MHSLTQGQPWCSVWGQIWGSPQNFTLCYGGTRGAGDVRGSPKNILNFRLCSRPCLSHSFSLLPIHPIHLCCNAITLILPGNLLQRDPSQPPAVTVVTPQKHFLQMPHHAVTRGFTQAPGDFLLSLGFTYLQSDKKECPDHLFFFYSLKNNYWWMPL